VTIVEKLQTQTEHARNTGYRGPFVVLMGPDVFRRLHDEMLAGGGPWTADDPASAITVWTGCGPVECQLKPDLQAGVLVWQASVAPWTDL